MILFNEKQQIPSHFSYHQLPHFSYHQLLPASHPTWTSGRNYGVTEILRKISAGTKREEKKPLNEPTPMPVPIILAYFGDAILPQSVVDTVVELVPIPFTSPYTVLLFAVMVSYLPFSISLIYKAVNAKPDNVNPRKQSEMLAATDPMFARILAAESNMQEGFPFFAAALLSATQAGVASATICSVGTFWLLMRLAFVIVYVIANNVPMSVARTSLFAASLMAVSKLFYLAAAK
jgi:uncharacterized MAPEG superfamily protein